MPHLPTFNEIEKLVAAAGVKRLAVENFLLSIDTSMSRYFHLMNLNDDARLYRWNAATVAAIKRGIDMAYSGNR